MSNSLAQKTIVTGVILIDKPAKMSSQQVVAKVKYLLKSDTLDSKKAGHTGTLDPMATGLLPICLGGATKFAAMGLSADKRYHATIKLGAMSDTGDKDGQIIKHAAIVDFNNAKLEQIAQRFLGKQTQIPPMVSALKKNGKKLYELARLGIEVERLPRSIEISQLTLDKISDDEIALQVTCSKGTYVRVLGEDIAKALGTLGHLSALRRVATGGFDVKEAITLADFEQMSLKERLGFLLNADRLLENLPKITINQAQADRLKLGQRLNVAKDAQALIANLDNTEQNNVLKVAVYVDKINNKQGDKASGDGEFLGLCLLYGYGKLQPKKLLF